MTDLEPVYASNLQESFLNSDQWGSTLNVEPNYLAEPVVEGSGEGSETCDCGCPSASLAHYMIDLMDGMTDEQRSKVLSIIDAWRLGGHAKIEGKADDPIDFAIRSSQDIEQDFASANLEDAAYNANEVDVELDVKDEDLDKIMKDFDFIAQKKTKLDLKDKKASQSDNAGVMNNEINAHDYEEVMLDFDIEVLHDHDDHGDVI